jgi:hypothetical protein
MSAMRHRSPEEKTAVLALLRRVDDDGASLHNKFANHLEPQTFSRVQDGISIEAPAQILFIMAVRVGTLDENERRRNQHSRPAGNNVLFLHPNRASTTLRHHRGGVKSRKIDYNAGRRLIYSKPTQNVRALAKSRSISARKAIARMEASARPCSRFFCVCLPVCRVHLARCRQERSAIAD